MEHDRSSPTATGASVPPVDVWEAAVVELHGQMPKATFDSCLSGARLLGKEDDCFRISVRNESAQAWLENRLKQIVVDTLSRVAGRTVDVQFVADNGSMPAQAPAIPAPTPPPAGGVGEAITEKRGRPVKVPRRVDFPGFEPLDSNWTQTPDMFFTYVVPKAHAIVTKLVAAVIKSTIGTFEDKRKNRRREEWPVNNAVIMRQAGIASKTSLQVALWDARAEGYLIARELDDAQERRRLSKKMGYSCRYTLRLRYPDDHVDYPTDARPDYGSRRKR